MKLTARIQSTTPRHAYIGVFQDGGRAGTLCVDHDVADELVGLLNGCTDLLGALKEIAKGEGAFSRDPLRHAENCIEHAKAIAKAAIALVEEGT